MFTLFHKKPAGETVTFKIEGMHCVSCSLNIDGTLEDTPGVISAETSYAQAKTKIVYEPVKVSISQLQSVIESLKYLATQIE